MGEAKRRGLERAAWPESGSYHGVIDLHFLPPIETINSTRIRELTGDDTIPEKRRVILNAFKAIAGERTFHVGFCLGNGEAFSAIGIAVIDRLTMEAPEAALHVAPIVHEDIAWDIVLRHLRSFGGQTLLFAFPDSDVYDAGTAEIFYSNHIRLFDLNGIQQPRLTQAQRRGIHEQKAAVLNRPPPPRFYPAPGTTQEDVPWTFRVVTPTGKIVRTAVWDGRRDYAHQLPTDVVRWVGGDRVAIVQVDRPVGVNRRSSLQLTHTLAAEFDGVIHWARDTETFQSIVKSFIRLDLESVNAPDLPRDWSPDVVILAADGAPTEGGSR